MSETSLKFVLGDVQIGIAHNDNIAVRTAVSPILEMMGGPLAEKFNRACAVFLKEFAKDEVVNSQLSLGKPVKELDDVMQELTKSDNFKRTTVS